MEGLTEGRIVHFVLPDGPHKGEHRPAIVVKVWRQGDGKAPENGYSNILVFMDGSNDGHPFGPSNLIRWETSVTFDPDYAPRTWHWIEKA